MNQFSRSSTFFWLVMVLLFMLVWSMVQQQTDLVKKLPYSQFLSEVESQNVKSVKIEGNTVSGTLRGSNESFKTTTPPENPTMVDQLTKNKVEIEVAEEQDQPWYVVVLLNSLPLLLLIGVWVFFLRQVQMGAGRGMSFGKSRAKLLTESQQKVTFADVAGIDEARSELEEIIDFLKDPKKFTKLGGRIPKGVLLIGSPGTGKTLLAKAIAGEAGVPFFSISGSDFVEMFVGVGASRVRDLFIQGKKNAPCIIFIDEIDAVGRHRGAGMGGGHDEREQTLNPLLVEMDGLESNEGGILRAAAKRPDVLDPALMRPGRFDRRVVVPRPDLNGRFGILKVHCKRVPVAPDVDLMTIARGTPGFSGADLEILVNEAALYAARNNQEIVGKSDFEFAKDKVMMGAERRSMLLSDQEKKTTAYHEAGHALVAKKLSHSDPVHKLTIVPRGMALGLMQQLPEADRHTYSRTYWLDQIAVLFGGRVAEQAVFNDMNTGASSDIERASALARSMVCEWGMSDRLGPIQYSTKDEHVFLGKDFGKPKDYSESTQVAIDEEVRKIIDNQYQVARRIIEDNIDILHSLAKALLSKETLDSAEIDAIVSGMVPDGHGPNGSGPNGSGPGGSQPGEGSSSGGVEGEPGTESSGVDGKPNSRVSVAA